MSEKDVIEKNTEKLSDEELEDVAGGSFSYNGKRYSDDTYSELGLGVNIELGNTLDCHPLIVTWGNSCMYGDSNCRTCIWSSASGITLYCTKRSWEHDPLKDE